MIDDNNDFDHFVNKIGKLENLMKKGKMEPNHIQYLPGMMKIGFQGLLYNIFTEEKFADVLCLDKKVLEFITRFPVKLVHIKVFVSVFLFK